MRYILASIHIDLFRKEKQVELEAVFSPEEADALKTELDRALLAKEPTHKKFLAGYELHRGVPSLKPLLHFSRWGQLGAILFNHHPLRIAFLQYVLDYPAPVSIEEISSVTEICGAAILSLTSEAVPFLPQQKGSAIFYDRHCPLPTPAQGPYLLLAFTTDKARYRFCATDPHAHFLKNLGYSTGDRLTVETHPYIIR